MEKETKGEIRGEETERQRQRPSSVFRKVRSGGGRRENKRENEGENERTREKNEETKRMTKKI